MRSGSCAAVVCADRFLQPRAAFVICVRGEAKANPICEIECGSRRRLAAVIFVPSLNRMILSAKVVVQRKRGSGTGRGSAGRVDPNRSVRDQSGLFWLLSPRLATGYVIGLALWDHIKSFYVIRTGNEGAYGA